ncbi:hypothetical protein [Tsukamurella pseudospumae]|uniref:hypothetical protein n=1 Tax=Tsukamurella pseudospumae TaxID=239498 RepID=UPI000B2ACC74|nr:hypothetical protein [Tsukamurella pseudospumae]
MAEGDPSEDQETIQPSAVAQVAESHQALSETVEQLGHKILTMQTNSVGRFPSQLNTALPKLGQSLTDIALRLHGVAASAQQQALLEAGYLPAHTEAVQTLKAAKAACKTANEALGSGGQCTPQQAQNAATAKAAEDAARSHLHQVWDGAATQATQYAEPIPKHGQEAQAAAQRANDAKIVQVSGGGQPLPDSVQQIVPGGTPAPRVETPNKSTAPSDNKPAGAKPSAEKNAVENADSKGQTPQQGQQALPQALGAQQGQGQQGGAQPQGGAPAGGAAAPSGARTTGVPVSQPTPVRAGDGGSRGGGVRPTASSPVQTPAQRAGLGNIGKGGSTLGSGAAATGAGGVGSPAVNKSGGGAPTSGGSGSSTSNSAARGPMGMMGGAGHGAGAGGGTARPKADIKSNDPRLRGEDVAAEALGGIVRETDGAPTPPAVPGVTAPIPPSPPKR